MTPRSLHDPVRELNLEEVAEAVCLGRGPELRDRAEREIESLELAAAALDVGLWGSTGAREALPERVRARVLQASALAGAGRFERGAPASPRLSVSGMGGTAGAAGGAGRDSWRSLGWIAAAAAVALAVVGWWPSRGVGTGGIEYRAASVQLAELRKDGASRVASWSAGPDASGKTCSGELVWSPAQQKGFMVFRGLRVNDPGVEQYQLWIFDKSRDERYPVHGGVFNVCTGTDETIVPIDARLGVPGATMFVITVEQPGGVWVSDRSRIAALAKLGD